MPSNSSSSVASAAVFGATGAAGGHILSSLLSNDAFVSVKTISRRLPAAQSPKLEALLEADTSKWGGMLSHLSPKPTAVFNAVGVTRAKAGGLAGQWKIDHDLCIDTAKAAKEAGVKTYVYVSSGGTRGFLGRYVPYSRMKVGVEDAIKKLDFETAIILRPGMILGGQPSKAPVLEAILGNIHKISPSLEELIAVDQKIIGRAAVTAARLAHEGKAPSKYWVLEQADIFKYGRNEWKE